MLNYSIKKLAAIVSGVFEGNPDGIVKHIITDSRIYIQPANSLFVALHGPNHNGHLYLQELISKGVKYFMVDQECDDIDLTQGVTIIRVNDTLTGLQKLAQHYRQSFGGSVLAITGSNGKTTVKEWLHQVLSGRFKTEKNPKSFNSQVGVPLSILQMDNRAQMVVMEAGISRTDEMQKLERMIKPDWGLITNLGDAHQENFISHDQKILEKLQLFRGCKKLYYCSDHDTIRRNLTDINQKWNIPEIKWSYSQGTDLQILKIESAKTQTKIFAIYNKQEITIVIPFIDQASIENLIHIWLICLDQGLSPSEIQRGIDRLEPLSMRLEQKEGINGCTLINDYYNSDFQSIDNAINLLFQQTPQAGKTIIISDILQSGESATVMVEKIKIALEKKGFDNMIGIGPQLYHYHQNTPFLNECYPDTESFLANFTPSGYSKQAILLKGARKFQFEAISQLLEKRIHRTIVRVRMPSLLNNLNKYREKLRSDTAIMVMVKALAYGSGTHEVARFLDHQRIDYLGVAFIDEGIALRDAGVISPIMVMNPDFNQAHSLISKNLEPEIYNLTALGKMEQAVAESGQKSYPIHIKIDTGMHRLGFLPDAASSLASRLKNSSLRVASIFTHLVAAGNPEHESFTKHQIQTFTLASQKMANILGYMPIRHILNTAGIESKPDSQLEMVRLGIGLYGISNDTALQLEEVIELSSYISQIHTISGEESVGYERMGRLEKGGKIGVIPVGYADGFDRRLGNGNWDVVINGELAPTIGNICMDMCMIDISHLDIKEGDEVILIGKSQSIKKMAETLITIPYEIMTSISTRVKRVYLFD
ncbi:MAG: bifunctional UDP-N-acetylmuramoyl-tripeptide:D-alanyl-D-alanine ligase/alanine racemase [Bacteroidetes bacterium]|jgi:Alr-MurF fusion protein|nr:bifunctional UDP-N-acetylmuramoyl-tripeptide:D-alanyl-D-alanine ligase/alanine racemase [Bacteroidota bacterium]MBT4401545.1 bifunctional UDP-N-acetylmuramoyl-tripeptide:D-alanyl-D-alanine ligase/alanine racemase [Bacteroidota bacterium]MBT7464415.1 bifunctional UDP-N-acetylmuramoyl-tripeptide:D-alanyl-D-alanine ligase/alanine racemase [Bacteroidota bacterium]